MAKVKLLSNLRHDGVDYKKGQTFDGDKELTDQLVEIGVAGDAKALKEAEDAASPDRA